MLRVELRPGEDPYVFNEHGVDVRGRVRSVMLRPDGQAEAELLVVDDQGRILLPLQVETVPVAVITGEWTRAAEPKEAADAEAAR